MLKMKITKEKEKKASSKEFSAKSRCHRKSKTKPMNFTEMPTTCVCGRPLVLLLQGPRFDQIAWSSICPNCRWRVTVSLTL
jgi:hypothetical protein